MGNVITMGRNWLDDDPAYPQLDRIAVPTLVIAGDRDHPDFAHVARLLAKTSGARLECGDSGGRGSPSADADRRSVHLPARRFPGPVRHCR